MALNRKLFRSSYRKPIGFPAIDMQRAPRGIVNLLLNNSPIFGDSFRQLNATNTFTALVSTDRGLAFDGSNSVAAASFVPTIQGPNVWSMEALLYCPAAVTHGGILDMADGSVGSATTDHGILGRSSGDICGYLFDGVSRVLNFGLTPDAKTFAHCIVTCDGTTFKSYGYGLHLGVITYTTQTLTVSNGGASTYTTPILVQGESVDRDSGTQSSNVQILHGIFSNTAWTAQEVIGRIMDPYGFLVWPDDDMMAEMLSAPAVISPPLIASGYAETSW